jgi:hypothetical protein
MKALRTDVRIFCLVSVLVLILSGPAWADVLIVQTGKNDDSHRKLVKYIEAYGEAGVPLWAVTPQN